MRPLHNQLDHLPADPIRLAQSRPEKVRGTLEPLPVSLDIARFDRLDPALGRDAKFEVVCADGTESHGGVDGVGEERGSAEDVFGDTEKDSVEEGWSVGPKLIRSTCVSSPPENRSLANHVIVRIDPQSMPAIRHRQQTQMRVRCPLVLGDDAQAKLVQQVVGQKKRFGAVRKDECACCTDSSFELGFLFGNHEFVEVRCRAGVLSDLLSRRWVHHCQP